MIERYAQGHQKALLARRLFKKLHSHIVAMTSLYTVWFVWHRLENSSWQINLKKLAFRTIFIKRLNRWIKYNLVCPCTTNLMLLYNIVMISLAHIEDLFPTERPYALFYYHPSFATLRTKCNIVQLCINTKSPNNWVICAMFGNMVLGICSYFRPHMFNDLCLPSFLIYI